MLDVGLIFGGYHLSQLLGFSGALAMVIMGIEASSNITKILTTSEKNHYLEIWETVDLLLNIIIYTLIGFMGILYQWNRMNVILFLIILPNLMWIRALTIYVPLKIFSQWNAYKHLKNLLIWGGLKGGLALAMALARRVR